ncbi:MAG: LysM peptidoglycan-binding domain-containing protein [Planctomycetes bacterium]|nr:LysM peptidoglycan-binding domain-containing protein [Planctomycetota bacterium]
MYIARLRAANEGLDDTKLAAGTRVLVPVRAALNEVRAAGTLAVPAAGAAPGAAVAWTGGPYKIKKGDVLGTISQTVYGSAKHWRRIYGRRIYDANKDLIGSNPNNLKVGMELRIPELK